MSEKPEQVHDCHGVRCPHGRCLCDICDECDAFNARTCGGDECGGLCPSCGEGPEAGGF
jgi:hypothetical protein